MKKIYSHRSGPENCAKSGYAIFKKALKLTIDNRATSAPWLLPPIALQILHYLDDADDAHAFLQAAPNGSLDDALDALRTLLAMDLELPLWPTPHIASLDAAYSINPSVVTKALPLFKKVQLGYCKDTAVSICRSTKLPPPTAVRANVNLDVISVRAALGDWLPNLMDLSVSSINTLNVASSAKNDLVACPNLRTLTIELEAVLDQGTFDAALTALVATCPFVEYISIGSSKLSHMSDCKALLAWLGLPTARHLELACTDFDDELGTELATALLTSSTLETLELIGVPGLTRAILSPLSPPLSPHLRHLTICDSMTTGGYDLYNDVYDELSALWAFSESDVAALVAKIVSSRLEVLELGPRCPTDLTSVVSVLLRLPTLTKLSLNEFYLTSFPPLRQLWHLEMGQMWFSDEAVASLATLLESSPKLVALNFGYDELPDHQVETILRALPRWLSHRGAPCDVFLSIKTEAGATALAAALAHTRSAHKVTFSIYTYGLSLEGKKKLVAVLASTLNLALCILGEDRSESTALEAYGRQHQLTIAYRYEHSTRTKERWLHSPRRLTTN